MAAMSRAIPTMIYSMRRLDPVVLAGGSESLREEGRPCLRLARAVASTEWAAKARAFTLALLCAVVVQLARARRGCTLCVSTRLVEDGMHARDSKSLCIQKAHGSQLVCM